MKCLSYIQGAVFLIVYRLRNSLMKKKDHMTIFKWNPPGCLGGKLQEFKIGQMSVSGWFQVDFWIRCQKCVFAWSGQNDQRIIIWRDF